MKKFIIQVTYEEVVQGEDDDDAEENAKIYFRQRHRNNLKLISTSVMLDDKDPCRYGKLNRTCDGTKCKVCEREDWIQAMNEDASDERYGLFERDYEI
jgi:hypothetical protein